MIVYRPHRGSLEDAMKEVKTFNNWYQMTHYIANNWNLAVGKKVIDPDDIVMDDKLAMMTVLVGKTFTWFWQLVLGMTILWKNTETRSVSGIALTMPQVSKNT